MLLWPGTPDPVWELNYCWLDLVRPHSSQQDRNGKEKKGRKPMATAALSRFLNPDWLHLYPSIIIGLAHEVMLTHLNAVKRQVT